MPDQWHLIQGLRDQETGQSIGTPIAHTRRPFRRNILREDRKWELLVRILGNWDINIAQRSTDTSTTSGNPSRRTWSSAVASVSIHDDQWTPLWCLWHCTIALSSKFSSRHKRVAPRGQLALQRRPSYGQPWAVLERTLDESMVSSTSHPSNSRPLSKPSRGSAANDDVETILWHHIGGKQHEKTHHLKLAVARRYSRNVGQQATFFSTANLLADKMEPDPHEGRCHRVAYKHQEYFHDAMYVLSVHKAQYWDSSFTRRIIGACCASTTFHS